MCEKPLAMDSEETAKLVELAAKGGLAAGVYYNIRFYPLNLEARDMVQRGDVGDIYAVYGSYVQDWLFYDTDYNWRVLAEQGGELRAVADIGTHWIDLVHPSRAGGRVGLRRPLHRPPGPQAADRRGRDLHRQDGEERRPRRSTITTDDYGCILFRFGGGAPGCCGSRSRRPAARTACATRSPAASAPWRGTASRRTSSGSASARRPTRSCCATRPPRTRRGRSPTSPAATTRASRTRSSMLPRVLRYIDAGPATRRGFPTFADGHREIVLCEAILESHKKKGWVKVEEV